MEEDVHGPFTIYADRIDDPDSARLEVRVVFVVESPPDLCPEWVAVALQEARTTPSAGLDDNTADDTKANIASIVVPIVLILLIGIGIIIFRSRGSRKAEVNVVSTESPPQMDAIELDDIGASSAEEHTKDVSIVGTCGHPRFRQLSHHAGQAWQKRRQQRRR